ncbi:MAG: hypothetical protein OEM32_10760, partial [Acidimicrobiia bacterium]|nr:hypothetical protein [Acidimicrobiia bacterium]
THLSIKFDEYPPAHPIGDKWLWSNSIGGRIGAERIDRTPRQQWVRQLAAVMGGYPSFLWGAAFDSDEFRSRNSYEGPDGMWALGRDVRRSSSSTVVIQRTEALSETRLPTASSSLASKEANSLRKTASISLEWFIT